MKEYNYPPALIMQSLWAIYVERMLDGVLM